MCLGAGPSLCLCPVLSASPHSTFLCENQKDPGLPESRAGLPRAPAGRQSLEGGAGVGGHPWFESRRPTLLSLRFFLDYSHSLMLQTPRSSPRLPH